MKKKISVRRLVEFLLREGDINKESSGKMDPDVMQAGSRLHRKIQKRGGSYYQPEVTLKYERKIGENVLVLEGRADGIITHPKEKETITVDEIKTTYKDVFLLKESEKVHLAQAKCYAYMYAKDYMVKNVEVQMTYANLETEEIRRFSYKYTKQEISIWFENLMQEYEKWVEFEFLHNGKVMESIKLLEFPFTYRKGQRDLAAVTYSTIKREKNLFVQAPTGIGKTISTIFPAVKAIGEGYGDRIFYLTAKTVTRKVAEDTFYLLENNGLFFSFVTIMAKEKICPLEKMDCQPQICEYAKGHYDRINEALYSLLTKERALTHEILIQYSEKYKVCPFELSLDAALFVDGIICDYNYVFDPRVYLKRFFADAQKTDTIFLIDEAHNLVDRGRAMYSAVVCKEEFLESKKILKNVSKKVSNAMERLNKAMNEYKKLILADYFILSECDKFGILLMKAITLMEELFEKSEEFEGKETIMETYFHMKHFLNMYDLADENYVIYLEKGNKNNCFLHLFCVNPSENLKRVLEKGRSAVFFSATLLPIKYYKKLLAGEDSDAIYLESPFEKEKRYLAIVPEITTKYRERNETLYIRMTELIRCVVNAKPGNYMVFFPSYQLMEQVYDLAVKRGIGDGIRMKIQQPEMSESERTLFLKEFEAKENNSFLAFCILGGVFSEGIDLTKDKLIGSIIFGNGLPMVCNEREILKDYFTEQGEDGFAYAYVYPGMNKVLQAAGRVIRTMEDEGVIILGDYRFLNSQYRNLFPREWEDRKTVSISKLQKEVEDFWKDRK